jgi:hypothetical protein
VNASFSGGTGRPDQTARTVDVDWLNGKDLIMNKRPGFAVVGLLAAAASMPLLADDDGHAPRKPAADRFGRGMQAVTHHAGPGEPGHGWQYFSDPAAHRAVVIGPQGQYYVSRGKGLRPVAATSSDC